MTSKTICKNASHELQTPLAIIRSKLELLINQPTVCKASERGPHGSPRPGGGGGGVPGCAFVTNPSKH